MRSIDGQYLIDLNSKYFQEDFPFGLSILKTYVRAVTVATPVMDRILGWYQKLTESELLDSYGCPAMNKAVVGSAFWRFGITKISDVEKFYLGE